MGQRIQRCLVMAAATGVAVMLGATVAAAEDTVFTVGKYPIEAEADNAVTAKKLAMDDGQRAAFHALMKRLVPVTAYKRIPDPKPAEIDGMTSGLNIRSEQNSRTEYLAEIDFRYDPDAVRRYLRAQRVPYLDRQAPQTLLVPIYRSTNAAAPRYLSNASGQRAWRQAWAGLDLTNTLTPVRLAQYKLELRDDVRQRLVDGDMSVLRILQQEYSAARILLAAAEPDPTNSKLIVTISGQDAVGTFNLRRSYPIEEDDLLYTAELATIIGLGVMEGRWKAINRAPSTVSAGPSQDIRFFVRFAGLGQWQRLRAQLVELPGVEQFDTGTVSARGAEVAMRYPGGIGAFRQRMASAGLRMSQIGADWVLDAN